VRHNGMAKIYKAREGLEPVGGPGVGCLDEPRGGGFFGGCDPGVNMVPGGNYKKSCAAIMYIMLNRIISMIIFDNGNDVFLKNSARKSV
jgi:hypothetical protein